MKSPVSLPSPVRQWQLYAKTAAGVCCCLLSVFSGKAQVTLTADGPGSTYERIESVLGKGTASEVPDCGHQAFGRHITEVFDTDLNKNVFVFHIHTTPDDDRCGSNTDRQRNEIKTFNPSPDNVKATYGETVTYRWKFKIDAGFIPTSGFCHLHQIKAGDGDDGSPLMTLTPRAGNPQKMQVIYTPGTGKPGGGEKAQAPLSAFKGTWVEVTEKIKYTTTGTYQITVKKVSDGTTLLTYTNNNIDMWRDGTTFCRPKWGIYRKLVSGMRDEQVRFADFCIAEGNATCGSSPAPAAATTADATASAPAVQIEVTPASPQITAISLVLATQGATRLTVQDKNGQEVARLLDANLEAGTHQISLDTGNLPAGNYAIKVTHNDNSYTKVLPVKP
ncbi:heparin lyase I family protein [Chitinophaga nivalis]|uniref:Heparin lyase I family protein n=1 Tax=Chitinophaga nivalis TaxID=2991709 RepID=A0ABT3IQL7_9BACT|nr:heparin lyase I family protein [Chitinophaga nivalis]MCW3464054.1 heparin lyase I family protein [Chitinophaga nivalis]MCW3486256.1 heparin lyase I family protein [Chitinophaga nivalis]